MTRRLTFIAVMVAYRPALRTVGEAVMVLLTFDLLHAIYDAGKHAPIPRRRW